ncbi:MAG: class I SAM-dependent methyltransferase [Raineya sp.]|jgi:ubiquinone/menaquinone biosynthesis C-methylase UbiE|nr:class I SAM-dependent methyltransferase [Raineya sp.]
MKDNFSTGSDMYAKYRPTYPQELFDVLLTKVSNQKLALDVGTGNGQVAEQLAQYFEKVYATDISSEQIKQAQPNEKIEYSVQSAEKTNFENDTFDLIVVAQAVHWFDFEPFYKEIQRILNKDGVFAMWGYGLIRTFPALDKIIEDFYYNQIGKYWDAERKHIDDNYQNIPFPLEKTQVFNFKNKILWNLEYLIGYLNTWSAVKHYEKQNGKNPVQTIENELKQAIAQKESFEVTFPIFMKVGEIPKS